MQDAQKTMGIITLALVTAGEIDTFEVPLWVILAAALAISAGTYSGGFRIMRTLGRRIIQLTPGRRLLRADGGLGRHDHDRDRVRRPGVDDAHHDHVDHGRRARPGGCRRSAGAWPATSSSRGSSRCRPPARSPPWRTSSPTSSSADLAP